MPNGLCSSGHKSLSDRSRRPVFLRGNRSSRCLDAKSRTDVERFRVSDFIDERRYAWRMIRAARLAQAPGVQMNGSAACAEEIVGLLDQALDGGLDRAEIIVELADLGGGCSRCATPTTQRPPHRRSRATSRPAKRRSA